MSSVVVDEVDCRIVDANSFRKTALNRSAISHVQVTRLRGPFLFYTACVFVDVYGQFASKSFSPLRLRAYLRHLQRAGWSVRHTPDNAPVPGSDFRVQGLLVTDRAAMRRWIRRARADQ